MTMTLLHQYISGKLRRDKKKGIPNGCVFAEYWHRAYKVPHNAYLFPV